MRDPNRIDKFCNELAAIWKSNAQTGDLDS